MFKKVTEDHEVITLYSDEDFEIKGEVMDGELYLHCSVDTYNKTVKKRIHKVFNNILDEALNQGFSRVLSYTQNIKFCKVLSEYEHLLTVTAGNGKIYEVIEWV